MDKNKYRGLTKEGKEVKGWYVKCRGEHYILPLHNPDDPESSFDERWIQKGADEDGWYKVIPETVGQFVCLDKNSKEVFAGDKCSIDMSELTGDAEPEEIEASLEGGFWFFDVDGDTFVTMQDIGDIELIEETNA